MKNILSYSLAAVAICSLISCKKNNLVIDKNVTPPGFVKIATWANADSVGTYYIKSTNEPLKIPIGTTNVSDKDRTINITYTSSSAIQGQQFTAPSSIVIPAGQAVDSLAITGIYTGYSSSSRVDTVKISISSSDVKLNPTKTTYTLYLRKYCDVNIDDFLGEYANSSDQQGSGTQYGPYTNTIKSITSTGPTSATAIIYNFAAFMLGNADGEYDPEDLAVNPGITVLLDWSNPAAFSVTVPKQLVAINTDGPDAFVSNATGGTFSSCDNTFTIKYNFKIGADDYGTFTIRMRR